MKRYFIEIDHEQINLNYVRRIYVTGQAPSLTAVWEWSDGTIDKGPVFPGTANEIKELDHYQRNLIAAQPGYWILMFWKEHGTVDRDQVIAWQLDTDLGGFHRAVGAWLDTDEINNDCCFGVLTPDGRVVSLGDACYETETVWLRTQQAEAEVKTKA
jgi:hypothetical protein